LLSGATEISDAMISASAHALADSVSQAELDRGLLYPAVNRLRDVTACIAVAVMRQAAADGDGELPDDDVLQHVQAAMWEPVYPEYIAG
jgi:malic enzyme